VGSVGAIGIANDVAGSAAVTTIAQMPQGPGAILFFAIVSVISIIPPALGGLMGLAVMAKLVLLLPVLMLCVPVGARMFHVVPERWYRRFAFGLLVTTGSVVLLA
jgi:hypothetical protein